MPRLVSERTVLDALAELVGVDVGAEHLDGRLFVRFEQGRSGEADYGRIIGEDLLHGPVHSA